MRRRVLVAAGLATTVLAVACTQSGTGVELVIDAGGVTLDQLQIVANYDGRHVTKTVSVATGASLDVIAQLPDEATTVQFEVGALLGGNEVAHGSSADIAVTPHHVERVEVMLGGSGSGGDGFGVADLANADGGAAWTLQKGGPPVAGATGAIRGIWASSGTDVYAVGNIAAGANAFHSSNHGATWTPQLAKDPAAAAADLNAVAGTASNDVYLVGDNATILHGSGTSWSAMSSPAPSGSRLNAIWALAPSDLYIAGSGNLVMHNAGSGWVTQTAVGTTELRGVWGVAGAIWAVGSGGTILKSTGGGSWTPETSGTPNELRAVFGTSATDLWVVGDGGVVLHSTGNGSWAPAADGLPADVSLRALGGRPNGPVWAAGNAWTILRRDTAAWVAEPTGLTVDDQAGDVLQAIWAPSAAEVFAGGIGPTLLHRP
jgi:hypothetical protein